MSSLVTTLTNISEKLGVHLIGPLIYPRTRSVLGVRGYKSSMSLGHNKRCQKRAKTNSGTYQELGGLQLLSGAPRLLGSFSGSFNIGHLLVLSYLVVSDSLQPHGL